MIDEFDSARGENLFAREVVRLWSNCFIKKDSQLYFFLDNFDKISRIDNKLPEKSKSITATFTFGKPLREGKYFESPDICVSVTSMEKSLRNMHVNLEYESLRDYNI